jgi:hypothetical protein
VTFTVPSVSVSVYVRGEVIAVQVNVCDAGFVPLTVPPVQPLTDAVAVAGVNCTVHVGPVLVVTVCGPLKLTISGWVTVTVAVVRNSCPAEFVAISAYVVVAEGVTLTLCGAPSAVTEMFPGSMVAFTALAPTVAESVAFAPGLTGPPGGVSVTATF